MYNRYFWVQSLKSLSLIVIFTAEAYQIVSKAAEHANEAMRRIVSFKKLLEAQEQIKGVMDLVSPTRMLLKEGKISKISARSSDHQERYLFLVSSTVKNMNW